MLNDILELWNIEDNFEFCFNNYCIYLEGEGKWKLSSPKTKYNYTYRMRQVHKGEIEPTKEWNKFVVYIDRMKVREQKDAERRAIKLNRGLEEKYKKLLEENEILKKQIETLKKDHETLKEKYFRECDSDYSSDDEPIEKIS